MFFGRKGELDCAFANCPKLPLCMERMAKNMRRYGVLCAVLLLIMVVTPLLAMGEGSAPISDSPSSGKTTAAAQGSAGGKDGTMKVLRASSNRVETMSDLDYVIGAVSAEMPPTYHIEALKAQAAACYTFALRSRNEQLEKPDEALSGAYLNDDSAQHQGYISKEESKAKWGDKFDTYYKKISEACEAVVGKAILYDGEPIIAAFHAICSGQTESAQVVWGKDIPYLQSVLSTGDKLSPDYTSTLSLTKEQFSSMAKKLDKVSLEGDAAKWFDQLETSKAGTVTSITIGGQKVTGQQVREAFGLRSACFTLEYKNDRFIFHVSGYGHCVGMSQYGADYMARQGSSWEEIIRHYYKGVEIKEL